MASKAAKVKSSKTSKARFVKQNKIGKNLFMIIIAIAIIIGIGAYMAINSYKSKADEVSETLKGQCNDLMNNHIAPLQAAITSADTCMADFSKKYHKVNIVGYGFVNSLNPKTKNFGWYLHSLSANPDIEICSQGVMDVWSQAENFVDRDVISNTKALADIRGEIAYLNDYISTSYQRGYDPRLQNAKANRTSLQAELGRRVSFIASLKPEQTECGTCLSNIQNQAQNKIDLQRFQTEYDSEGVIGCTKILNDEMPPTATPVSNDSNQADQTRPEVPKPIQTTANCSKTDSTSCAARFHDNSYYCNTQTKKCESFNCNKTDAAHPNPSFNCASGSSCDKASGQCIKSVLPACQTVGGTCQVSCGSDQTQNDYKGFCSTASAPHCCFGNSQTSTSTDANQYKNITTPDAACKGGVKVHCGNGGFMNCNRVWYGNQCTVDCAGARCNE